MVLEGASPRQVDGALEDWGMAMGILAVFDMAGIDVGVNVHRANASRYPPDPSYYQADVALHEAGRLGQKSGKGYYRYEPGNRCAHRRSRRHRNPSAPRSRAANTAARAQCRRDPGALSVPADERRFSRAGRGRRAARRRHRRGLDLGVRVPALSRRADVPRGGPWASTTLLNGMRRYRDLFGPMHWEPAPLLVELVERKLSIAEWEREQRAKRAQS